VTTDRVKGTKGSKVLRTRKIKQHHGEYYDVNRAWNYFCSQGCQNDFWEKHGNAIRQIAPRLEPLETPIHDPKKTEHEGWGGRKYYTTTINKLDNESNVG
jgi:YHS domain-containing protein